MSGRSASRVTTPKELNDLFLTGPFDRFLGVRAVSVDVDANRVVAHLASTDGLARDDGAAQIHGGAIAAAIDIVGDMAATVAVGAPLPTVDLRIDYLRSSGDGTLTVVGEVRRAGRTVVVCDVEVRNDTTVVALGRATYLNVAS
jgi:uncharacterized protein (TIGR00369 family)